MWNIVLACIHYFLVHTYHIITEFIQINNLQLFYQSVIQEILSGPVIWLILDIIGMEQALPYIYRDNFAPNLKHLINHGKYLLLKSWGAVSNLEIWLYYCDSTKVGRKMLMLKTVHEPFAQGQLLEAFLYHLPEENICSCVSC